MESNKTNDEHLKSMEQISTFAVLDIETSNLPAFSNNRVSITELCIYAFDPASPRNISKEAEIEPNERVLTIPNTEPLTPRVVHKLNILFQPSMRVSPEAENITGLNNYILERESKLNENAGQLILRFLQHLAAPVCLIAHNGWKFDFPIIKQAFHKLEISMPETMLCVDSLRAFMEIDEKRKLEQSIEKKLQIEHHYASEPNITSSIEETNKAVDWQAVNETTPKRRKSMSPDAPFKRTKLSNLTEDQNVKARRQLFSGLNCSQEKRIPPRGQYKLAHLFERTFEKPALGAHQAEADVIMLMKLVQHYGVDFVAFAEEQAIPFTHVIPLGAKR